MFNELTNILDGFINDGIPGYDCIVLHKGNVIYRHMNGYSDKQAKIPVSGNERYNLYSASKMITCTAALILYEKNLISLEDKLYEYMPEFRDMYVKDGQYIRKASKHITVENLFCMTAGFSYNLNSPMLQRVREDTNGKCPTREVMRYLAKEPLLFEPGERWEYSLCHDVLAALVETVSGVTFGEFVKKHIFDPLGMKNSTYKLDDSQIDTVSTQYTYNAEKGVIEPRSKAIDYKLGSEYESGGAGCISTLTDYTLFLEALRKGELLSKETVRLMSKNRLVKKQLEGYWVEGRGYGLGVACANDEFPDAPFGWGGAAGAYPLIDINHELTFFYIQHVLNTNCDLRNNKLYDFFTKQLVPNI